MSHYAIGDLQGCFDEFELLLNEIGFNHGKDTLWLTGDIVNRGPKSLKCLEYVMHHDNSIQIVLGNHDLHLLAVAYGYSKQKRGDTLDLILNSPDLKMMLNWLSSQTLLLSTEGYVMAHAGILPDWEIKEANFYAREVEYHLKSQHIKKFLKNMYGNQPVKWSDDLTDYDRLRMIVNSFTRMRAVTENNELDYTFKGTLADMPEHLSAWFHKSITSKKNSSKVIFGHWSALGYMNENNIVSLDTGAIWGGKLTAYNLETEEMVQVKAINK